MTQTPEEIVRLTPEEIAVDLLQRLGMELDGELIHSIAAAIRDAEERGAKKEREAHAQVASLDGAVVYYVRSAAKRVYGESCSFVIDDIDRLSLDANAYRSGLKLPSPGAS